MKNKAVIIEYILAILGYIEGIILCLSLVFLPIGIYAIYGASLYLSATKLTDSEIGIIRNRINNYAIFFSVILFPIGLLALIIVPICASHNISVEDTETTQDSNWQSANNGEAKQRVVSEEELKKLEELKVYRERGIITEDEFEKAKRSLFED